MSNLFRKLAKRWWREHFPPAIPSGREYKEPLGETEYIISPDVFNRDRDVFRKQAVEVTRALLNAHPREVAEIAIEAEPFTMPEHESAAYQELLEAGMTVSIEKDFWGQSAQTRPLTPLAATEDVMEASLTLLPYTHKAVFVDENGGYLVNYYESGGTYQLWLPDEHRSLLRERLSEKADSAILSVDRRLNSEQEE